MTSGNNILTEYLEINKKNDWLGLYQRLRAQSLCSDMTCYESVKPQNKPLNRYRDVSPYDHSRIVLNRGSTDYINANLIRVEKANRQYILTQGPLSTTYSHFWLMVWEQDTAAIIMLNKLIEKKVDKCYQYWPSKIGSEYTMHLTDVGLSVEYMEQRDHSYYLTRVFRLTDTESGQFRDILQYHYITWPDFGVPSSPTAFLDFLWKVKDAGVLESNVGPAIIHCSAGIGRSGTFCLVDSCLYLIEKFGLNSVDVKQVLVEMRENRMGLIQTPEQLRFSYLAIIEGTKQLLSLNSEPAKVNHVEPNTDVVGDNNSEHSETVDSDDEPPPLPPPRTDSLKVNGQIQNRPLPNIPKSVSDDDLNYITEPNIEKNYIPSGPLPVVPAEEEISEEDELEEEEEEEEARSESPVSDLSDLSGSRNSSSYEVRQRNRKERKDQIEAQVRDMKRRQQINEQWTQLKRPKTSLQD